MVSQLLIANCSQDLGLDTKKYNIKLRCTASYTAGH